MLAPLDPWEVVRSRAMQRAESARKRSAALTEEVAQLRAELSRREQASSSQVAALRTALADLVAEQGRLRAWLEAILASSSWRLTAPLRRLLGAVTPVSKGAPPPAPRSPQRRRALIVSGEPETPGQHYRVLRLQAALEIAGLQTDFVTADALPSAAEKTSLLVLWRLPWTQAVSTFVKEAKAAGSTVVFDVDDLMVAPELAQVGVIDGIRSQGLTETSVREHYGRIRTTMLQADWCLSPTAELARHMRAHKPTLVVPNGYDQATLAASRIALRRRRAQGEDGFLRIGYASGSRTHQRDFCRASAAVAAALRDRPNCRLVLFHQAGSPLLDVHEYPEFAGLHGQIEWRAAVPLAMLPEELARFDVNLAPLETGNPYCEAKSELKFFEAALVEVPTVASPTGPFRRAIRHGETGLLASDEAGWRASLDCVLDDIGRRRRIGRAAYEAVLWPYGPARQRQLVSLLLDQVSGGDAAARSFALEVASATGHRPLVPQKEVVWTADHFGSAAATVAIPLFNYEHTIVAALDSVAAQTLSVLDLVVVDDRSIDGSLDATLTWLQAHASRFNRIVLACMPSNVGLGGTRNVAFDLAETEFVLPLDADNLLRPACCEALLDAIRSSGAAYAYPEQQRFNDEDGVMGTLPYSPARLIGGPYIDALALIDRSAWRHVGGYPSERVGWEDFRLWCKMAEAGLRGVQVPERLADYRVHAGSMLHTDMAAPGAYETLTRQVESWHPWLSLVEGPLSRPLGPRSTELWHQHDAEE